jgi:hypothetical protein
MGSEAKAGAQRAVRENQPPEWPAYQARSTQVRLALARQRQQCEGTRLEGVGRYSETINMALTGPHTRWLYDAAKRCESNVFAQLRTGMARIGAADTDMCDCGQALGTLSNSMSQMGHIA